MRLAICVPSLAIGGAERFIIQLLGSIPRDIPVLLITLHRPTDNWFTISHSNVQVRSLELDSRGHLVAATPDFIRWIRDFRPTVIQGFLYGGDALGLLAKLVWPQALLVGSIRNTELPPSVGVTRSLFYWITGLLTGLVAHTAVANSQQALHSRVNSGYRLGRVEVVPNIVQVPPPTLEGGSVLFSQPTPSNLRFGLLGRYVEGKGHLNLVSLCRSLRANGLDITIRFAGKGTGPSQELAKRIQQTSPDMANSIDFCGYVDPSETYQWLHQLDFYVMASTRWESFPNALGEAIAALVPSVGFRVGATEMLLGPRLSAPSGDNQALLDAVGTWLSLTPAERLETSLKLRAQLMGISSQDSVVRKYLEIWSGEDP